MSSKPDVVYFELNNWTRGEDYPDIDPYLTWMYNDLHLQFADDKWVRENGLVVVRSIVDMSANFCITALKSWVDKMGPELLTDPDCERFLRYSDENGKPPIGCFDCPFLEWSPNNFGVHFWDEELGFIERPTWNFDDGGV